MRAFEPFKNKFAFEYPEDMAKIIKYLKATGKINVDSKLLEDLYYKYSDTVACSWRIVDDESLAQFAEFLSRVELYPGGCRLTNEPYLEDDVYV